MTTFEKKQKAIREGQVFLYQELQNTLVEISGEMLGTDNWDTEVVDRMLDALSVEIKEQFGEDE